MQGATGFDEKILQLKLYQAIKTGLQQNQKTIRIGQLEGYKTEQYA